MRKLSLVLSLLCIFNVSAFAGGVSGGGGNTKPADPVTDNELYGIIAQARKRAASYFNYIEWDRRGKYSPAELKLFTGESPITERLTQVRISISDGPCEDERGNLVDGSARATLPQSVCLSKSRLMEKLGKDNARTQITALVVHEYSHLLGTTEEEADALQAQALAILPYADYAGLDGRFRRLLDETDPLIVSLLANMEERIPWRNIEFTVREMHQRGFWPYIYYPIVTGGAIYPGFKLWPDHLDQKVENSRIRYELLLRATCVLARSKESRRCKRDLDQTFRGDREISYATYQIRNGAKSGEFIDHPGVSFRRVTSYATARVEFLRLLEEYNLYHAYVTPFVTNN